MHVLAAGLLLIERWVSVPKLLPDLKILSSFIINFFSLEFWNRTSSTNPHVCIVTGPDQLWCCRQLATSSIGLGFVRFDGPSLVDDIEAPAVYSGSWLVCWNRVLKIHCSHWPPHFWSLKSWGCNLCSAVVTLPYHQLFCLIVAACHEVCHLLRPFRLWWCKGLGFPIKIEVRFCCSIRIWYLLSTKKSWLAFDDKLIGKQIKFLVLFGRCKIKCFATVFL